MNDRSFVVLAADAAVGRAIAAGLRLHGTVAELATASFGTLAEFEHAFASHPITTTTIVLPVVPAARPMRACIEMSDEDWVATCERPLRAMRYAVQAARRVCASGSRIVLVSSTAALTGEAGLTGYSVVSEGARALVRVVSRGWGKDGITLHWVGVPTALMTGEIASEAVRDAMWDHALGRGPDLEHDVAPAIAAISAPEMHFVTGTATVIDGGLIMLT